MESRPSGFLSKKSSVFVLTSLFSLILIIVAYVSHHISASKIAQYEADKLKGITNLKINQIVNWHSELSKDAKVLSQSPLFVAAVEKWLNDRNNAQLRKDILSSLELSREEFSYEAISLYSPNIEHLLFVGSDSAHPNCVPSEFIKKVIIQHYTLFTDFYFCNLHKGIHYDLVVPIQNMRNEILAVLLFRINLSTYFYPLIQSWPTPSKSSETFVFKKQSDGVLYLNELRHQKNTALRFWLPITRKDLPAVQAVMGKRGIFVGKDYRGVEVLAYLASIPGTNWYIISKTDRDEIFSELQLWDIIIVTFVLLLIIAFSVGVWFIYNNREKNTYKTMLDKIQYLYNVLDRTSRMAKVGGWEFNAETFQGTWTSESARIYDLDPDDPISAKEGFSFYVGESKEKLTKAVEDAIHKGIGYDLELEMISAKGVKKWVHTIGVPIIENGKVVKIEGSIQDITERKLAEKEIQHLNWLYAMLSQTNQAIVRLKDEDELFNQICKIAIEYGGFKFACVNLFEPKENKIEPKVWANDGNVSIQNALFNAPDGASVHFPCYKAFQENLLIAINNISEYKNCEYWRQSVLKENIQSYVAMPFHFSNQAIGVLELYSSEVNFFGDKEIKLLEEVESDISYALDNMEVEKQRKRAELDLAQLNKELERRIEERTAQLVEANKELEAFAYSVSHDLQAPLRHVSGFIELLKKNLTNVDDKTLHHLKTISEAAARMGRLINDLLTFSRLGRAEVDKRKVNCGSMINEIIEELRIEYQNRNISWKISPMPLVEADYSLLRQVFANLIANAIKFTSKREFATIELDCKEENNYYVFSVKDNGAGFDMLYYDKLFGVFQRLHPITEFGGTGIGLANVKRIVTKHGGTVWAEARIDEGATFYFTIPI
jgi:signal transduction histidine kinase/PAS domain-containing protein